MFGTFSEFVCKRIQTTRAWSRMETPVTWLVAFATTHLAGYKYVAWRYGMSPQIDLYVQGYMVVLVSMLFVLGAGIFLVVGWPVRDAQPALANRQRAPLHLHGGMLLRRSTCILLLVSLVSLGVAHCLPQRATNIEVIFLPDTDDFDKHAFAYIIYELNKRQKHWYFDVRFEEFNENSLLPADREKANEENGGALWWARYAAQGKPLIAVTSKSLGDHYFWDCEGNVSVISTCGWDETFAPPGVYEYLAYSLVSNSILIHLNQCDAGTLERMFQIRSSSRGDLFEVLPERKAIKAAILAARLTPEGEQLLLNSLGFEYLRTCSDLLTLTWLRSAPVKDNLSRCYGVDLQLPPAPDK